MLSFSRFCAMHLRLLIILAWTTRTVQSMISWDSFKYHQRSLFSVSWSRSLSSSSLSLFDIICLRGGSTDEDQSTEEETTKNSAENVNLEESPSSVEELVTASASIALETEVATILRLEGKALHDQGDFIGAASLFQEACDTLMEGNPETARSTEEYATCRLHQALCQLKCGNYELCINACTDVLQDDDGHKHQDDDEATTHYYETFANKSPAVKSRAYHRRAKAKMALGDTAGALQDARTAAFLGDGKAVSLYGRLMRESSSSSSSSSSWFSEFSDSTFNPLMNPQSPSPSSALLESLLRKSSGTSGSLGAGFPDFSPASFLLGNSGGVAGSGANAMLEALGPGAGGSLAKSVIKNLSKRLDDKATHEQVCNFLQRTNKVQLRSLASLAGMNGALPDDHLDTLVNFCHGVKPKHIRQTVRITKVTVYMINLIRRILKVLNKYKTLIAALFIMQWTKSATFRPIPINKRAARIATKKALKEGMKATRGLF